MPPITPLGPMLVFVHWRIHYEGGGANTALRMKHNFINISRE